MSLRCAASRCRSSVRFAWVASLLGTAWQCRDVRDRYFTPEKSCRFRPRGRSRCAGVTVSSTKVCKFMQNRTALPARDVAGPGERFTSHGSGDSHLMHVLQRRAALLLCALAVAGHANAQVVISQVYGGGGNSGATFRSDFVELHNIGSTTVSLDGWSVQYAPAAGSSWQVTPLAGSVPAGGYYWSSRPMAAAAALRCPRPMPPAPSPWAAAPARWR